MNCVIIEDEIPAQRILKSYIEKLTDLHLIGCFNSAIKANDLITTEKVDLLFLDINLPDISGMNYLNILKNSPHVIVTTAYPDYAVESFEKDIIIDYLMKPFSFDRFLKAVNKVKDIQQSSSDLTKHYVYINLDKTLQKVNLKSIDYIESEHNYVSIQTDTKKYTFVDTLKNWEQKLSNSHFIQIHKSFIVNTNKIDRITGNQLIIEGKSFPIGRTYKAHLLKKLNL